jgi:hypothetical protein
MAEKGLFNKVKNRPTRRRFVVSTIRKDENLYETAIFEANFFYLPRRRNQPDLALSTSTPGEAWELHAKLAVRFTHEFPARLIREYCETPPSAPPQD